MLPYSRQVIGDDDIAAVVQTLQSRLISQGPAVQKFEEALADYCGSRYAVVVSSGTAALHLACLVAGVSPGDEVVTSPLTFVASANCALYCGARPGFADVDPLTVNLSPQALANRLLAAARAQRKVAAIIPVHYAGYPCEMEKIRQLSQAQAATVIEDGCHALGARWQDQSGRWRRVGDCSYCEMTVFSFHPVKAITTGEGGAITTNERSYYERLVRLRDHGLVRAREVPASNWPNWYYEMRELGYNYRISDLQSALGRSQLRKLPDFLARRRQLANNYRELLHGVPGIKLPPRERSRESANHLFAIRVRPQAASRNWLYTELARRGIASQVHYIPVHLHPYYRSEFGYAAGSFPHAESFYREALSLPLYPTLKEEEQLHVVRTLMELLSNGQRPEMQRASDARATPSGMAGGEA